MQTNYKKLAYPIALNWLNGDESWKTILENIVEKEISKNLDEETTFFTLVKDIKSFINESLLYYIEESIYDILSEREVFNEQEWEGKSEMFRQALKIFLNEKVDDIASNVLDSYVDDVEYSRNKNRYFGVSNNDF